MILHILIKKDYDDGFFQFVMSMIHRRLLSSIKASKLKQWDEYFKQNNISVSAYEIIKQAAKHLKYTIIKDDAMIMIDNNVDIDNKYSLISLCKLINNGNLETKAYPIFTQTFEYIAKHIRQYELLYRMLNTRNKG